MKSERKTKTAILPGRWIHGAIPSNVSLGDNTLISGDFSFKRFHSRVSGALVVGAHCTMEGVHFAVGENGKLSIGDYCYFTNAVLLCELEVHIGSHVLIGWNATIADTDFHPIDPAERISDAMACSPLAKGRPRPDIARRPVVIEDNVWIGPNAAILKGVRVGQGCIIEPGTILTRHAPRHSRIAGNPGKVIGKVR